MENPEGQNFREAYVISMSDSTSTTCDVNDRCCSLILDFLGDIVSFPCPFTAPTVDARSYLRTLTQTIVHKLVNLGLVRSPTDSLPFDLIRFVWSFTRERHVCPLYRPSLVPVARITVAFVEDGGVGETLWTKRAVRGSFEAMVVRVRGEELEDGDAGCVVCFERLDDDVARMPCGHVFHRECIGEWLKKSHVCPLCRFEMPFELFKISRRLAAVVS